MPCHEPVPGGCSCGQVDCASTGKHPRIRGGLHEASTDPDQIRDWWHRWPTANIAVRTGTVSGLVVIDIDPPHGPGALAALAARHGLDRLPATYTVRTGSGGIHLHYRHPSVGAGGGPVRIANSASRLRPGLDVRADGGYVIAPPSRHPTGTLYRLARPSPVAELPDWLYAELTAGVERRRDPMALAAGVSGAARPVAAATRWAQRALDSELDRVRHAPDGKRNHTLNRAAFVLGQLAATGHLDPDQITDALVCAALDRGLGEREVRATITSGITAGRQHPRSPNPTHTLTADLTPTVPMALPMHSAAAPSHRVVTDRGAGLDLT